MSYQLSNQHLLWRAAFGPSAGMLSQLNALTPQKLFVQLQQESTAAPALIEVAGNYLEGLASGVGALGKTMQSLDDAEKRMLRQRNREGVRQLNLEWMDVLVHSKAQLREKLAFFWHGHFAARNLNMLYQQQLLHILRTHALGSFRTLLHEVSKSAAMLNFLNAAQNRKGHPNENFAREVMELFTLGRGHYSEQDVKEAARAFTGWGSNLRGEFQFRPLVHDAGKKQVLGRTANFTGEAVLDLLLEQEQTARFITRKIYRFFVNEQVPEERLTVLAKRFFHSDYDIGDLVAHIFTSDWFYKPENTGNRIKSPVELLTGIRRMLPLQLERPEALIPVQQVLGQVLLYPPNVAGWPGGRSWIDATTLTTRMRLPLLLAAQDEWHLQAKTDDDQQMGQANARLGKLLQARIDWQPLFGVFAKVPRAELNATLSGFLLQTSSRPSDALLGRFTDTGSREAYTASLVLRLMASPEYQLC